MLTGEIKITSSSQIIPFLVIIAIHSSRDYLIRNRSYTSFQCRKKQEFIERRLEIILQAFPDGLIIFDTDFRPELVNEKMLDYLEATRENIMEKLIEIEYVKDKKFQSLNLASYNLYEDLVSYNQSNDSQELILGIVQIGVLSLQ